MIMMLTKFYKKNHNLQHLQLLQTFLVIFTSFPTVVRSQGFYDCRIPLGMVSGDIKNYQIITASVYNNDTAFDGSWARLGSPGGYRADPGAQQSWIMVQFPKATIVTGIATQGFNDTTVKEWLVSYNLGYGYEMKSGFFKTKKENGNVLAFDGNSDSNSIVLHYVPVPETVSTISILPIKWNNNFAVRFELYGCLADGYECISTPCQNNGTCTDLVASYYCNCTAGFTGVNCQIDIDDCVGVTCYHGGSCVDLIEDYTCNCPPGYSGKNCQIDINECQSVPCQHGGICADFINGYKCTCTNDYGGKNCQEAAGFFLVVWLQIKNKSFLTPFLDTNSVQFTSNAAQVKDQMTKMLKNDEGFLSAEIRKFSPGEALIVEIKIKCLINSTYELMNTTSHVITNGYGIFKNNYVKFEDRGKSDCKPANVALKLSKTLATPTDVSRYQNVTISMETPFSPCTGGTKPSYRVYIYSINNVTAAFKLVYTIVGLLSNVTTWVIPARALMFGVHYVKVTSSVPGRKGTNSVTWGLILVGETKLISTIVSGNVTYQGAKSIFYLNGSLSYDPDLGPGIHKDMEFIWLCKRSNETFPNNPTTLPLVSPNDTQSGDQGGCYGSGVGRLEPTKEHQFVVGLDVDWMKGNTQYIVALVVKKQERSTWSEQRLYVKEEIDISLTCVQNCKSNVIPSERLVLEKRCEGLLCNKITSYEWILKMFNTITNQWTLLPDISDYMLTYMNSPTIVTKENKLLGNSSYLLTLIARAPGDIIDTTRYRFDTNAPPSGGRCEVDRKEGEAWLTYFTFTCLGWEDQNLPLSYKFRYYTGSGIVMVFFSGKSPSARAKLPVGNKEDNYGLNIQIQVSDSIGSDAVVEMSVKVLEPKIQNADLDDAVSSNGDIENYLKDNNIEMAAQHSTSVLSVVNNAPNENLALRRKIKIKDSIVNSWSSISVKNLDEIGQVSAVVSAASDKKAEVSMKSQESLVSLLGNMASVLDTEADDAKDGEEMTIQSVGTGLLQGIGNLMDVAAWNASVSFDYFTTRRKKRAIDSEYKNEKSIALVSKTINLVDKVADSLVKTKKLYEIPTVFKTKSISMILDRQRPDLIGGKAIQDGDTRIVLPSSDSLTQNNKDSFLSTQLVSMKSNPFTWDSSAEDIKSSVVDLKLKSSTGTNININDLNQDFSMFIPVKTTKEKPINLETFFVKPSVNGSMQYHVINIPGNEYAVSIQLRPLSGVNITIYVRYGSRPTINDYNYTATVPDFQTCNYSYNQGYFNCTSDPYTVTISSALTGRSGIHYLGVAYWNGNSTNSSQNGTKSIHSRTRRDCFSEGGRHKRSLCVQVKDPPPTKPTSWNDVPSYNPIHDVNYTLSVTMATCLYWDVASQIWTSRGCRVGPLSKVGQLHCICNHLTSFGGNFFVAPNPIDFNKIMQRFTDFDAKNFVVLIVVFGIFGLYVFALVFARRADRRDEVKVFETLRLSSSIERDYEISIYTGMWRNNGTTANVGLKVYGHQGESDAIYLSDRYSKRQLFARASINTFMTSLPESLGDIVGIKLWHDNEGDSPSWYVNQVVIRDLQTDKSTFFICKRWLAVDKEDGEVQANFPVATKEELASFSYQFSTRISKSLGDGHLWLSVATRPPHSPFTRVQRVSCCLSVLYCAMVASAMFYQFGAKDTSNSYKFGALRFSIRQLMIGIQSALVIVPLNVLIVTIFRNVKPPNKMHGRRYSPKDRQPGCLPHFFVYVGWFLCICSIVVAGSFTVLYSLSWGGEVANQWLTSVLIAFVQDIGVIQPIKVVALAFILALIIKKPVEEKTSHSLDKTNLEVNPHVTVEPLRDEKLENARSYSRSLLETFRAVGEIAAYLLFVCCLFIFVYQNRGYDRYHLKRSIEDIFVSSFNEIATIEEFWTWAKVDLVPGLYDTRWYNLAGPKLPEGYISSKEAFLVGMPRLRQIRLNPDSPCQVSRTLPWVKDHFTSCLPSYEHELEETTRYNLPGWIPVRNTSIYGTLINLRRVCPIPWRYQSSKELNTFNIHGVQMEYDGGGYVADLGYNSLTSRRVIDALESDNWFDRRTALLLAEFTVYEPSSSLFSHAKFVLEMVPATGKPVVSTKIETLSLYESQSLSFRKFFVVIQILLLLFIFFYLIAEVVKLMRSRCGYFKSFWNWMDLIQLLSAITATVLFFFKANFVSSFIKNIQANPYETTSIDYVLLWCNLELYVISVVIFVVTIKFLRLLRFNRHICQMTASMKHSFGCIATYTFVFLIDMISFGFLGVLVFGPVVKEYSNLVDSLRSLFQKFLGGETLFEELIAVNRIIGPLFVIIYMVTMTFILVNMFVAILNDSYESVRTLTGGKFPDSDLGIFMRKYYKKQFRVAHDAMKRKLGKVGYRTKLYSPKKEEQKEDVPLEQNGELIGYSWLGSKKYYPGQINGGFIYMSETNISEQRTSELSTESNQGQINNAYLPESAYKPINEIDPCFNNKDDMFQQTPIHQENQSLDSVEVAIETDTASSMSKRSSTPELLDLISDLPESIVDDEDTVDIVREKLSNVGAILRLSKRSYRRFSTSGDKFVVQRQFNVGRPVELTFTPKMTRKLNINFQ